MKKESYYTNVYQNESEGRDKVIVTGWPHDRFEAAIIFSKGGQRVLDVGCGSGRVLYNLRNKYDELHGIELSEARAETARRTLHDAKFARVISSDIENGSPYEDSYFNTVVCCDVIEHFVDVRAALNEMYRILMPGGNLVIVTPNVADIRRRLALLRGKFPSTGSGNEGVDTRPNESLLDAGHLHYFTYSMLLSLLGTQGFSNIKIYGMGRFGKLHNFWPSLLSPSCVLLAEK